MTTSPNPSTEARPGKTMMRSTVTNEPEGPTRTPIIGYPAKRAAESDEPTGFDGDLDTIDYDRQGLPRDWRWALFDGIAAVFFGGLLLSWPGRTLQVLAVVLGLQLILGGVFWVAGRIGDDRSEGRPVMGFVVGALAVIFGITILAAPDRSLGLITLMLGVAWMVAGAAEAIEAILDERIHQRGWHVIAGLLSVVAGMIAIVAPIATLLALAVFAGSFTLVVGVGRIVAAIQLQRSQREDGPAGPPAPTFERPSHTPAT